MQRPSSPLPRTFASRKRPLLFDDTVATSAASARDLGGTIRAADVLTTLANTRNVLRQIGITRVANVTGLDHVGVPTWVAVRPLARSLSVSQGKGLSHELARASAIMECIELHHAEHFVPRGHRCSLRAAADDERYANPLLFPIHPDARELETLPAAWVEGHDLVADVPRFVPRDCIDIDSVSPRDGPQVFIGSSNGLASGNTLDEATVHAICEVVERDQESLWYTRKHLSIDETPSRLRLETVTDAHCRWLLDRCRDAGLDVLVWYATQSLYLPCFVCTVLDPNSNTYYPHRASGSGCHPYRRIALARAITEALQSRLTHITGGRDDMYWSLYRGALRVDNEAGRVWGESLQEEPGSISYEEVPEALPMTSIGEILDWVLAILRSQGFGQVIRVDLTQPRIGVPVVHVSIPGLEPSVWLPAYTPGPRMQQLIDRRV